MKTRSSQTVLESRLITTFRPEGTRDNYQLRCLSSTGQIERFIVVKSGSREDNPYQTSIAVEVRVCVQKARVSIKTFDLELSLETWLQSEIKDYLSHYLQSKQRPPS